VFDFQTLDTQVDVANPCKIRKHDVSFFTLQSKLVAGVSKSDTSFFQNIKPHVYASSLAHLNDCF